MKRREILRFCVVIGFLMILAAFLLWRELSFVLAGIGIIVIGVGTLLYINKKE